MREERNSPPPTRCHWRKPRQTKKPQQNHNHASSKRASPLLIIAAFKPMNPRTSVSLLCALTCALPAAVYAQDVAPPTAIVTAVEGTLVTLAIGTETGASRGAIYQIARGKGSARLQIVETGAKTSTARILSDAANPNTLFVTVGDSAQFLTQAPLVQAQAPPLVAPAELPPAPPAVQTPVETAAETAGTPATPPARVLVTGIAGADGKDVLLGAGSATGIKLGAVYVMPVQGEAQARMIVVEVSGDGARARLLNVEEGFIPTVGENARFVGIDAVPPDALPVEALPTVADAPPLLAPSTVVPPAPQVNLTASKAGALSGSVATVTAIDGAELTFDAGAAQGAFVGQNLPVLRGGAVIGLVRVTAVAPDSARATVVYSDAAQGAIAPGDAVGLIGAKASQGAVTLPALGVPNAPVPSVPVRFESGASNVVVPKTEATYELLAALATRGLIASQPARVFQDDGARRHRVAEDIRFSRAQIAGFIVEALARFDGEPGRDRAALALLVRDYRSDLLDLNVPAETLAGFGERGVQIGVSSWTRLRVVGGDKGEDSRDAFDERFGANRRKTGLDSRTNVFGTLAPKLSFYASLDAGTDVRNGEPFGETASSSFRKAYLSYDAGSLLRGLSFRVGRQEYWWGPGHFGTGLLSDAAGGLDSVSARFERGSYQLRGMYARLGRGPAGGNRSLYAQDINVRLGKSAKIGVNTALLLPKDGFDPLLFGTALTPFPLYVARSRSGNNDARDNNAVVSGYGEVAVARGARVYGEVILDDFALTRGNPIENRDGVIFGLEIKDPRDPARAGFNFEYGRFNSVAYTNFVGRQGFDADYDYYFRGAPLGYVIAPTPPTTFGGAENLRLEGYLRPLRRLTVFAGLQFADLNAQDQNPPGPTGNSRQRAYRLALIYDLNRRFTLTGRFERVDTDHPNFQKSGPTLRQSLFSLELGRSF